MMAKSLVEQDIAVPGDWKKAEGDPTSFTRLTLERWIKTHGVTCPRFCTTASERVYITARGCETGFAATRGL
jgi:hypothetical protein